MSEIVTVTVAQGKLRGREATTKSGVTYYSFQGIPYAKPPVGPLRFKAPQPVDSWEGTRDALIEGPVCAQMDLLKKEFKGEEDCLYLNVYTPKVQPSITDNVKNTVVNEELNSSSRETRLKENKRLRLNSRSPCASKENKNTSQLPGTGDFLRAVMVWIHGGGFAIGDGNAWMYGPDYLVAEDVVLVTMNYRLGPLGFICLEDSVVPGNNGLKDQVMALRWVQQNIAQFGGDPGNVTIFGGSSGGACVHYHMMSPMSEGLFHHAISQSGSAINPWAFDEHPRRKAFMLGEILGCRTNDSAKLLEFLRTVPVQRFIENLDKVKAKDIRCRGKCLFTPAVERGKIEGEETFLDECPTELMSQGRFHKVPYLTGINSHEGLLMLKEIQLNPQQIDIYDKNFEMLIRRIVNTDVNEKQLKEVAQKVKKFYFGDRPLSQDTLLEYVDLNTDVQFVFPIFMHLKHLLMFSTFPIYCYRFSFDGKLAYLKHVLGMSQYPGVCHADEIGYLFRVAHLDSDLDPDSPEVKTRARLVKMWTNFAKTGCPTPKKDWLINVIWKPTELSERWYLNIDTELTMQLSLNRERITFWEDMFRSLEE